MISNLSIYRQSGLIEQRNETRLLPFQDSSRDTELTGVHAGAPAPSEVSRRCEAPAISSTAV